MEPTQCAPCVRRREYVPYDPADRKLGSTFSELSTRPTGEDVIVGDWNLSSYNRRISAVLVDIGGPRTWNGTAGTTTAIVVWKAKQEIRYTKAQGQTIGETQCSRKRLVTATRKYQFQ